MANELRAAETPPILDSRFSILHSPLLLILADDLTGAADCAARGRHAGLPATIFLRAPGSSHVSAASDDRPSLAVHAPGVVVAFTTDSRHLAPAVAAERVRTVLAAATASLGSRSGAAIWYKKIDSTLRGNLGSELDAMLDGLAGAHPAPPCAVVSPAFPAHARGVADGYLAHAQTPPRTVHLPSLLAAQSRRAVAAVALADVRQGRDHLGQVLAARHAEGHALLAVDALSEDDLETVFDAARQTLPSALFCGSAGLVGVIATRLAAALPLGSPAEQAEETPARAVLAVVGSGSEMAHRQLARLGQEPGVQLVEVDATAQTAAAVGAATEAGCVALHLPRPAPGTPLEGEAARRQAERLAQAAVEHLACRPVDTLVLVGGDTAIGVLTRLGVDRLDVMRELLPGVPLTEVRTAEAGRLRVILKAGNHGDDSSLVTLALHPSP